MMKASTHWRYQRFSAIFLLFLLPWFLWHSLNRDVAYWVFYFVQPHAIVGLFLLLLASLYHVYLGWTVILEDYIAHLKTRAFVLLCVKIKMAIVLLFAGVCFIKLFLQI